LSVSLASSPFFMVATPTSQPLMTEPAMQVSQNTARMSIGKPQDDRPGAVSAKNSFTSWRAAGGSRPKGPCFKVATQHPNYEALKLHHRQSRRHVALVPFSVNASSNDIITKRVCSDWYPQLGSAWPATLHSFMVVPPTIQLRISQPAMWQLQTDTPCPHLVPA
jgi:hypothetical protein